MTTPAENADARFELAPDVLALLLDVLAAEQSCAPQEVSLEHLAGEWLDEQLADLIDRAQDGAIVSPHLNGQRVAIIAYTLDDGLILAIRHDPLFYTHGAQIDSAWDEPAAFIPMREDGIDLDLHNLEGILRLVVERANTLLPALVAATRVLSHPTRKEQP